MFFSRLALAAAVVSAVSAFSVTSPGGPDKWWVAGSDNVLNWDCNNSPPASTFTVLVANQSPSVLANPIAVISVQNNFDCSKLITTQMFSQPVGTGYIVQLASVNNQTDIYAQSEPFEIKPAGSSFPNTSSSIPAGTSTGTDTGSASTATPTKPGNGASLKSVSSVFVGFSAFLGLLI